MLLNYDFKQNEIVRNLVTFLNPRFLKMILKGRELVLVTEVRPSDVSKRCLAGKD